MNKICSRCGGMAKKDRNTCPYCGFPLEDEVIAQTSGNDCSNASASQVAANINSGTTSTGNAQTALNGGSRSDGADKWREKFKKSRKRDENLQKLGIILTNTRNLHDDGYFSYVLGKYVEHRLADDICYILLDLKDLEYDGQLTCEHVVEILGEIYEEIVPHYLMIVGDYTVIPCIEWKNESGDSDKTVPSDLPYITLDTRSPWDGQEYSFENITQVGRIPTSPENNFEEAINYFTKGMDFEVSNKARGLAYSAYVWKETSKTCFSEVAPTVLTSPNYTSNKQLAEKQGFLYFGSKTEGNNLLCFNLHGSNGTHLWYGQYQSSYPEAFAADLLPQDGNGYVICTEACYGARPQIIPGKEKGIVVRALENNCIAFVGSSRIAYGLANGKMSCADIIANEFSECVAQGKTVGEAFLCALKELTRKGMGDTQIKTMAEFALYADPSVRLVGDKYKAFGKGVGEIEVCKAKKSDRGAVRLMRCDENMQPKKGLKGGSGIDLMAFSSHNTQDPMEIKKMVHNVTESSKSYVLMNHSEFKEVKPEIYKVVGKDGYRAVYTKEVGDIVSVVKLCMNDKGEVKETYISK